MEKLFTLWLTNKKKHYSEFSMKHIIEKIDSIISQIDKVYADLTVEKQILGVKNEDNKEELLDELTSAANSLEEAVNVIERDEAWEEAKQQMQFSL